MSATCDIAAVGMAEGSQSSTASEKVKKEQMDIDDASKENVLLDGVSSVSRVGDINFNGGSETSAVYSLKPNFKRFLDQLYSSNTWDDKSASEACGVASAWWCKRVCMSHLSNGASASFL